MDGTARKKPTAQSNHRPRCSSSKGLCKPARLHTGRRSRHKAVAATEVAEWEDSAEARVVVAAARVGARTVARAEIEGRATTVGDRED